MTCIIGLRDRGKVWIGGDSAGVNGWMQIQNRTDPKVFKRNQFLIGYTTSFRMGQLLQYRLNATEQTSKMSDQEYMATTFIDAVRSCLKDGGFASLTNGTEKGGTFLVGYRGRLYCIESDYQVAEVHEDYMAVGCGADIALGAMWAMPKLKPEERITKGLTAAESFSAAVRKPFVILSM